ncbi:MAG TPA: JAB domain-containing protein [Chakrabartia sp.]|jgi:DNA repair protein RadC|nr:JAB domain-containing protein [Chakrabartia sp.]
MDMLAAQNSLARFAALSRDAAQERLLALYLRTDGSIIGEDRTGPARGSGLDVPVRHIAARALVMGADAIVLAHNHPGGDPHPSKQDLLATARLERALFPFAIRVADHVIVGASGLFSFRAAGLL